VRAGVFRAGYPAWARPNATHLDLPGWSPAVLGLRGWDDHDCRVGWSAVAVMLPMVGSFDGEVAHLSFDHAGVAAVSALNVDLVCYFVEEEQIVSVMIDEGGKIPVSISWTG